MTPAKLANWHLERAYTAQRTNPVSPTWLNRQRREYFRFHLAAALLVIAKASGGNTRTDAARMLREMSR
jgi:hypothetical protein